jgi:hypothetical protein
MTQTISRTGKSTKPEGLQSRALDRASAFFVISMAPLAFDYRSEYGAGSAAAFQGTLLALYLAFSLLFLFQARKRIRDQGLRISAIIVAWFCFIGITVGLVRGQPLYTILTNSIPVLLFGFSSYFTFRAVNEARNIGLLFKRLKWLCGLFLVARVLVITLTTGIDLSTIRYEILGASINAGLGLIALRLLFRATILDLVLIVMSLGLVLISVTRTQLVVMASQFLVYLRVTSIFFTKKMVIRVALISSLLVVTVATDQLLETGLTNRWIDRLFVAGEHGVDPTLLTREAESEFMRGAFLSGPSEFLFGNGIAAETSLIGAAADEAAHIVGEGSVDFHSSGFGHEFYLSVLFVAGALGGLPLLILLFRQVIDAFSFLALCRRAANVQKDVVELGAWGATIVIGMATYGFLASPMTDRPTSLWYGIGIGLLAGCRGLVIGQSRKFRSRTWIARSPNRRKIVATCVAALFLSSAMIAFQRPARASDAPASLKAFFDSVQLRNDLHKMLEARPSEPSLRKVQLRSGTYRLTEPLRIGNAYSGSPGDPTLITGDLDGSTRLVGSTPALLNAHPHSFGSRVPPAGAAFVALDLAPVGGRPAPHLTERGAYVLPQRSELELFQDNKRLHPARWPKAGFSEDIIGRAPTTQPPTGFSVTLPPELYKRWSKEPYLWMGGFWQADWDYEKVAVSGYSDADNVVQLPPLKGGSQVRRRFRFFVENAISELSQTGEFVFDPNHMTALVLSEYPPAPIEIAVADTLLEIDGAHDIVIQRIAFEKTAGTIIKIRNSTNVVLRDCFVGHGGLHGIEIVGGANVRIERCVIRDLAETAVEMTGGDRKTLTPSGHTLADSVVTDFGVESLTYRPAVRLHGVGNRVEGCFLSRGPHSAIVLAGNDNVLTGNEISNVVRDADDAGAIYVGRDLTERGNLIQNNFLHEIGAPRGERGNLRDPSFVSGVYLDDRESGYLVQRNVFLNVSRPIIIHGGRDNVIRENSFFWPSHAAVLLEKQDENENRQTLEERLDAVPYKQGVWAKRYPELVNLPKQDPASPLNNVAVDNVVVGGVVAEFRSNTSSDAAYLKANKNRSYSTTRFSVAVESPVALAERLLATTGRSSLPLATRERALNGILYLNH